MLQAATPKAWIQEAVRRWPELLTDHANCEKKAASTALALLFAYPEDRRLCMALARLAREELRHFEQVQKMMTRLAVPTRRMGPGRYATALRSELSRAEPHRKLDLLLCGALIEARSCERFENLAPALDEPLRGFYADLAVAERRHESLYLGLAEEVVRQETGLDGELLQSRLTALGRAEARLATEPDPEFRFHSGPPMEPLT